ncbi:MAG: hypothetical protein JSW11_14950 [Candidatus Heimdallarchaeota archaeon]|nr:MAG: hypothetical protein JSW11_14950 [Candidatus Heimdallarchaeota archaeon]
MTTHNSYGWSLTKQLDQGIRGFELDIHDVNIWAELTGGSWDKLWRSFPRFRKKIKFHFKVGHWWPGHEVRKRRPWGDNPRGDDIEKWLGKIADWSRKNEGHAPITVFLDLKAGLLDTDNEPPEEYGLIRLNEQILNVFKDDKARLYTLGDFTRYYEEKKAWPTIKELRNKIIVVLMSFHYETEPAFKALPTKMQGYLKKTGTPLGLPTMKTRITYQEGKINSKEIKQICFVAFNSEDRGKTEYNASLEKKSWFVTPHPPENYAAYQQKGKLVRTDHKASVKKETFFQKVLGFLSLKKQELIWPHFPENVNFPVTDHWEDEEYRTVTDWVT